MITLYGLSKGAKGVVDPSIPLVVPLPANAQNQLTGGTPPVTSGATSAYTPPGGAAFDGNENTFVRMYTYAGGTSTSTYTTPVTPLALEVVCSGTQGYSGEVGYFGGPGEVSLDGITLVKFVAAPSPTKSRWRVLVSGVTGTVIRIHKPPSSRFLVHEVYLYV